MADSTTKLLPGKAYISVYANLGVRPRTFFDLIISNDIWITIKDGNKPEINLRESFEDIHDIIFPKVHRSTKRTIKTIYVWN